MVSPHSSAPTACVASFKYEDFKYQGSFKYQGFPGGPAVKKMPAVQEPQQTRVRSLGREDALEEGMATHSSILAWREEPGGLQSIGSQRVRLDGSNLAHTSFLYPYRHSCEVPFSGVAPSLQGGMEALHCRLL